jgi:simple sugar transport system permease protein
VVFQLQLQARGVGISPFFLDMLPYVLTILVLLIWGRAGRQAAPASLGRVYYGTE